MSKQPTLAAFMTQKKKPTVIMKEINDVSPEREFQKELNEEELPKSLKRKIQIKSDDEDLQIISDNKIIRKQPIDTQKNQQNQSKQIEEEKSNQLATQNIQKVENSNNVELKNLQNLKSIYDKKYDIVNDAPFFQNQDIPFNFLSSTFEFISETKGKDSKNAIIDVLSKMFRSIITPDYEVNELGIGKEILIKAISKSCGREVRKISKELQTEGDLGLVAANSKSQQKTINSYFAKNQKVKSPITLREVYQNGILSAILLSYKGTNSSLEKEGIIQKMIFDSKPEETKYIIRYIDKNLKIGCAEKTMQSGLTKALFDYANHGNKRCESIQGYSNAMQEQYQKYEHCIKRALCEYPNYEKVIQTLIEIGTDIEKLKETCRVTPGIPCKPMLAKPTKSIQQILNRFENMRFTCEYKYDGLRGQLHYMNGEVTIYSRNLENMTETYPDVTQMIRKYIPENGKLQSFILDSEIVAFDTRTNKIKSFQELSHRAKKNVQLSEINVKVCLFMFDLIYLNGESQLQKQLSERRENIKSHFTQVEGDIQFAQHQDTEDVNEIQEFLNQSVLAGCEGLMIKTLDQNSSYEPAKRSFKWLKLKKDYLETGLGDSFDLVPVGAFHGNGKRVGLYGAFLLACYNEDMECFETFCKIGTGFSDEMLKTLHSTLQESVVSNPPIEYKHNDFKCDVWFEPTMVWEVKGADLQISPTYTAGIGETGQNKGIGLRFPRFLKIREDKKVKEATDSIQIYEAYKNQAIIAGDKEFQDDDDFY